MIDEKRAGFEEVNIAATENIPLRTATKANAPTNASICVLPSTVDIFAAFTASCKSSQIKRVRDRILRIKEPASMNLLHYSCAGEAKNRITTISPYSPATCAMFKMQAVVSQPKFAENLIFFA
jgi:hypothetical protein